MLVSLDALCVFDVSFHKIRGQRGQGINSVLASYIKVGRFECRNHWGVQLGKLALLDGRAESGLVTYLTVWPGQRSSPFCWEVKQLGFTFIRWVSWVAKCSQSRSSQ